MTDAIIFAASLSWWFMLLVWPIAIAVAAILWGANAYIEFRRPSYVRAVSNVVGMVIVIFAGITVMQSWDILFIAWLPSGLRPIYQVFMILFPWIAVVIACAILLRRQLKLNVGATPTLN